MFKFTLENFVCISEDPDLDSEKGLHSVVRFRIARQQYEALDIGPHEIGSFKLAPMPGCCGVVVSTESILNPRWRGSIPQIFHRIKEQVAKQFGYSLMIATVQSRNYPEVIGASHNGWKFVHTFRNKRTTNDIGVMVKDI